MRFEVREMMRFNGSPMVNADHDPSSFIGNSSSQERTSSSNISGNIFSRFFVNYLSGQPAHIAQGKVIDRYPRRDDADMERILQYISTNCVFSFDNLRIFTQLDMLGMRERKDCTEVVAKSVDATSAGSFLASSRITSFVIMSTSPNPI